MAVNNAICSVMAISMRVRFPPPPLLKCCIVKNYNAIKSRVTSNETSIRRRIDL